MVHRQKLQIQPIVGNKVEHLQVSQEQETCDAKVAKHLVFPVSIQRKEYLELDIAIDIAARYRSTQHNERFDRCSNTF
jgi:hypothetical protein